MKKRRILSFFMALVMFFTSFPMNLNIAYADTNALTVSNNGVACNVLTLDQYGKETLTAAGAPVGAQYHWEILDSASGGNWVKISGKVGTSITLSYATVKTMLNDFNSCKVRAVATLGESVFYSNEIAVSIKMHSDGDASIRLFSPPEKGLVEMPSEASAKDIADDSGDDRYIRSNTKKASTKSKVSTFNLSRAVEDRATTEFVTVEINYIYTDDSKAFESYIAVLEKGSDFNADITSPSIVGYQPYVEDTIANSVKLSYKNLTENQEIYVVYKPKLVKYTVRYYIQNLNNDLYTEDVSMMEQAEGETDSYPDSALTSKQILGMQQLYFEASPIAADGSSVYECQYDREYYLINFDLAGGYGVDPLYARYGAYFVVNTPVKHGYKFMGWDADNDGVADVVPTTIPAENLSYTALWKEVATSYSVVYWRENANDNGYSYWGSRPVDATSGDIVDGVDDIPQTIHENQKQYFTFSHADQDVLIEGDGTTVVNVYYSRNKYTITFRGTGLCAIPVHVHTDDCYEIICGKEVHVHDDSCGATLTCTQQVHPQHDGDCCSLEEHSHTVDCYGDAGNATTPTGAPTTGLSDGYIYRRRSGFRYNYYIYINGAWYTYNSTASNGAIINPDCGKTAHAHGNSDCECDTPIHTHGVDCYSYNCGHEYHEHSDACKKLICTTTTGHTHTTSCNNASSTNTIKLLTLKYDADIAHIWPIVDDHGTAHTTSWWKSSATNSYYTILEKMPGQNLTLTEEATSGNQYDWYYYLETYPGQDLTGLTTRTEGGVTYFEHASASVKGSGSLRLTYDEDYFPITGFTQRDTTVPTFSNRTAYLYYRRNQHTLAFNNNGEIIPDKQFTTYYGVGLADKYFVPDYPDNLEKNAYEFDGWYTRPEFFAGTKVDFSTYTMPDNDVELYAYWKPVTHTINVYYTYTDMQNKNPMATQVKPHGSVADYIDNPTRAGYRFTGWFYTDSTGARKIFNFRAMPVNSDLEIYADWTSDTLSSYLISYVEAGTGTKIADNTKGYLYVGQTKTFSAKGGPKLYERYRDRWYPTTNSHSVLVDEDSAKNTYSFEYVYLENVPYTVKYLNKLTNEELAPEKYVAENQNAVVTEKFAPISDFISDSYYKQLILSGNPNENVITFYYLPNEGNSNAYYVVNHYTENVDTPDTYDLYTSVEGIGEVGDTIVAGHITIDGFEYNDDLSNVSGKVSVDGLSLNLYYDRVPVGYTVKYLEYGSDTVLYSTETGTAPFGSTLERTAPEINGYVLIGDETRNIEIRSDASQNTLTFYYSLKEYTIRYVAVCSRMNDTFGGVYPGFEIIKTVSQILGSVPIPENGYKFIGWYEDANCTIPVNPALVSPDTYKLMPNAVGDMTYYALFEPVITTLKINKTGVKNEDANQSFLFNIKGIDDKTELINLTISIQGNGSKIIKDLPCGMYEIKELTDWSWRYNNTDGATREIDAAPAIINEVTFTNNTKDLSWLGGETFDSNTLQ